MWIYGALIGALVLVGADMLIKQCVVAWLQPIGTFPIWEDVLHLTYHENTGAAFSFLSDGTRLLIAVTAAVLALMIAYLIIYKPKSRWLIVALSLIIAGGLGNMVDRVTLGYVIDYIDVRIINFAVFNFADCCAVVGTIMTMGYLLFSDVRSRRAAKAESSQAVAEPAADAEAVCEPAAEPDETADDAQAEPKEDDHA